MQTGTERPRWHGGSAGGSSGGWERRDERFGRRRSRLSLHEIADLRDLRQLSVDWRLARPEITVYTPNQIRHLIRLDTMAARGAGVPPVPYPTVPLAWIHGFSRDLAQGGGPWRMPEPIRPYHVAPAPPTSSAGATSGAGWWDGVARGLPFAAVVLTLLVLLARGAEKCFDKSFFKLTRRRSEEWPTPNVLATNLRHRRDLELPPPLEDVFPLDPRPNPDPPPPYSQCATRREPSDEPPPPYSACYVTYSNPKDGLPSVHFFNSRRQRLFGSSGHIVMDTGQGPSSSNDNSNVETTGCDDNIEQNRVENVNTETSRDAFENRIAEPSSNNEIVPGSVNVVGQNELSDNRNDRVEVNPLEELNVRRALVA